MGADKWRTGAIYSMQLEAWLWCLHKPARGARRFESARCRWRRMSLGPSFSDSSSKLCTSHPSSCEGITTHTYHKSTHWQGQIAVPHSAGSTWPSETFIYVPSGTYGGDSGKQVSFRFPTTHWHTSAHIAGRIAHVSLPFSNAILR